MTFIAVSFHCLVLYSLNSYLLQILMFLLALLKYIVIVLIYDNLIFQYLSITKTKLSACHKDIPTGYETCYINK